MLILALDTSSAGGSGALLRHGRGPVVRGGDPSRSHGEQLPGQLMTMLDDEAVALHDVDLFAVSIGPGSFTGLRVGIATIQGLALASGKPVVPVSTFEALAWQARTASEPVATWIDAHRGEVFAALFSPGRQLLCEPSSVTPAATLDAWSTELGKANAIQFVGSGAVRYQDVLEQRLGARAIVASDVPLLAGAIAEIAATEPSRGVRPHAIAPLYVRRPDAELARDRAGRR
jgi:tRNA threonylcarbamoyladenosine biosynthesis protein TsaB